MPSLLTLGIGGLFTALTLVAFTAGDRLMERRRVNRVLRRVPEVEVRPEDVRARALAAPMTERVVVPGLRRIGKAARRFAPAGVLERLAHHIAAAGSPPSWDAERLLAAKLVAAATFGVGSVALAAVTGLGGMRAAVLGALLGYVGYQLPEWLVRSRASKRQQELRRALPDSLDLLAITVQAGLGFDAAVERVSDRTRGPLGDELRRLLREMQLGKNRSDALRDLADRNDVPELKSFVLAMVQADIFGISVARVLDVQSREMRLKRRQRAEEQAHKVPIKILFPVLLCIFPSLFLVILGPAVIQLYRAMIAT